MDLKQYLAELEYLVNIDSCSDDPVGLNTVAEFFCDGFSKMSWIVEKHSLAPNSGTCVICKNREAEHYDLMLMGHIDTVFTKGTCAERPFRIEGNFAYGPGVADMKQGSLLIYHILKNLPREINDKLNILAVFNPDEEISSIYSRSVYEEYAKITDYAYVYEASAINGARCVERKGAIGITVDFAGKAGHCGYVFSNGAKSAVSEMARWIVGLDSLQNEELNTTVNVGIAKGGTKQNVVADSATISASIRFIHHSEMARAEKKIEELTEQAKKNGIEITIRRRTQKAPLVMSDKAKKYIEHVSAIAKANGMDYEYKLRGGLSDANIIAQHGVVCIDGMGPSGTKGHEPGEYMVIDSIIPAYNYSNLLIKDLAENKN